MFLCSFTRWECMFVFSWYSLFFSYSVAIFISIWMWKRKYERSIKKQILLLSSVSFSLKWQQQVLTKDKMKSWQRITAAHWTVYKLSHESRSVYEYMTGNVYVAGTSWSSHYVLLDVFEEEYIVQYLNRVTRLKLLSILHFLNVWGVIVFNSAGYFPTTPKKI